MSCHVMCVSSCSLMFLVENMQKGGAAPASKSRNPLVASLPFGFGQKNDATVDIPLDSVNVINQLFVLSLLLQHFPGVFS